MALVRLIKTQPLTPAQRWKFKLLDFNQQKAKHKFSFVTNWRSGRGKQGKILIKTKKSKNSKQKIAIKATLLNFKDIVVVKNYIFNFCNEKPAVLCVTKRKGAFLIPSTNTNQPGLVYYGNHKTLNIYQRAFTGLPVLIGLTPYYLPFCNIAVTPFKKYKYATASGVYSYRMRATKRDKLIKIKLPSSELKMIPNDSIVIVGKTKQLWKHKRVVGKSGINSNKGKKQTVRGIVMNSVDHPHGGKANSVQPERSPWGWVTKHSH